MATAYAPMASQVMKQGSLAHSRPRGLSGAALTRRPRFTVKAIQPEKVSVVEKEKKCAARLYLGNSF
jgi:photosystem I subunit XI